MHAAADRAIALVVLTSPHTAEFSIRPPTSRRTLAVAGVTISRTKRSSCLKLCTLMKRKCAVKKIAATIDRGTLVGMALPWPGGSGRNGTSELTCATAAPGYPCCQGKFDRSCNHPAGRTAANESSSTTTSYHLRPPCEREPTAERPDRCNLPRPPVRSPPAGTSWRQLRGLPGTTIHAIHDGNRDTARIGFVFPGEEDLVRDDQQIPRWPRRWTPAADFQRRAPCCAMGAVRRRSARRWRVQVSKRDPQASRCAMAIVLTRMSSTLLRQASCQGPSVARFWFPAFSQAFATNHECTKTCEITGIERV